MIEYLKLFKMIHKKNELNRLRRYHLQRCENNKKAEITNKSKALMKDLKRLALWMNTRLRWDSSGYICAVELFSSEYTVSEWRRNQKAFRQRYNPQAFDIRLISRFELPKIILDLEIESQLRRQLVCNKRK